MTPQEILRFCQRDNIETRLGVGPENIEDYFRSPDQWRGLALVVAKHLEILTEVVVNNLDTGRLQ